MKNKKYRATFLKNYTPPPSWIKTAELLFTLDPKETWVKAKLHIQRNTAVKQKRAPIKLDGTNLNLKEIKLNNKLLPTKWYKITPNNLTISQVPDDFVLETTVIINPEKNLTCTGLYLTNENFCTQNEPHGFRHLTYFIDHPDILTKFTTTIIADRRKYPVLLSNGNMIAKKNLKNNLHQVTWLDPFPKSAYLFALVAGKFFYLEDNYQTKSRRRITLRIYIESQQLIHQCQHAMLSLKQAMLWDEENFGLEYDLALYQIVAINDLNIGAMENKGLNVLNTKVLLASPLTATDIDFKRIAAVIAHEYFHNWTGNRITCRDWFQIGLKEGLTTLREQLFMEDLYGQSINRISTIKTIYTRQFPEDAGPLAHPIRLQSYIEVDNFYTTTVYYKSAEVARMLITIFGRRIFQKIIQKFLAKFDGQAVTIEDFIITASKVIKIDLKQFKLWYDQCGTPLLKIKDNFKDKIYSITIEQKHKKAPQDFYIPLAVGLLNSRGKSTATQILTIKKDKQTFSFKGFDAKPIPSFLRNFSSPIKIQYLYSNAELLFLIQYDNDPISCWEASQKLITNVIYDLCQLKQVKTLPEILIQLFKFIISNKKIDPALAAQMLELPCETHLLEILPGIDIENIHTACEFIKITIAKNLKTELLDCYKNNHSQKSYKLHPIAIGKRKLKNVCLDYLMYLNTEDIFTLCKQQLDHADNLTDIYASLVALANSTYKKRELVLESFYKKWRNHPNLVNNWLTLNANIKLRGNLNRVKKLLNHPAFNLKNPNNVYALIRTFCENNLINFHAKNSMGYKFLTSQILTIDKFNPQLAAILATPLTWGYKFDEKRSKLMQKQLRKIKQTPGLSPNVYEIIARAMI
ncbi:MAG: aminopeptidase N [Coxiellaceae bacterium]|jgi:aminopeptidase N|nr:aminopeptidase N [Coxiellaceae bacterium]